MLSISRKSAATTIVGRSSGRTTSRNICHAPAPSMRAASSGSSGIICSAARIISIVNGNHSHTSAIVIAHSARCGVVISEGIGKPRAASSRCIGLTSGV
jgi:hypothetical protein